MLNDKEKQAIFKLREIIDYDKNIDLKLYMIKNKLSLEII